MIFSLTLPWEEQFPYSLTKTTTADQLVLPVGIITTLVKGDLFNWGTDMIGALLGKTSPFIICALLMGYCIGGLAAGAIKA
jgi:multiple sugar transport system permease protein